MQELVVMHTGLMVGTTSRKAAHEDHGAGGKHCKSNGAGLQASGAGGENYNYKSGNIEPSEYCKYRSW